MPSDKQSPLWSGSSFIEGGLKQINAQDMERVLTGKIWNAALGVEDDAFVLNGRTRPEDLSTELQVLAAFCQDGDALGSVEAHDVVSGPTDRRFQRLLWRTASALFPDDYEDTYGFGLLPNSFDFGFGGEEPPIGDDPLAPPEDYDPLDPPPAD